MLDGAAVLARDLRTDFLDELLGAVRLQENFEHAVGIFLVGVHNPALKRDWLVCAFDCPTPSFPLQLIRSLLLCIFPSSAEVVIRIAPIVSRPSRHAGGSSCL